MNTADSFTKGALVDVFRTDLGWMALLGDQTRVARLAIGHRSAAAAEAALAFPGGQRFQRNAGRNYLADVRDLLRAYAAGEAVDLTGVPIDVDDRGPFQRRVIAACRAVAYGDTVTYGQLAAAAGSPRAARAVGQTMASNRHPLLVPCHRVVAAAGSLGGFSGPGGTRLKRKLLALEAENRAADAVLPGG